jgi:hypothetical protein
MQLVLELCDTHLPRIGHHGWLHWMNDPITAGGYPNTDLWPDVSTYSREELFPIEGLEMQDGNPPMVFSSRHPKTVHRYVTAQVHMFYLDNRNWHKRVTS